MITFRFQRGVRFTTIILTIIILVCSLSFAFNSDVFADDASEQLSQANSDLERLKSEQANLSSELTDLSSQLAAEGQKIATIDSNISEKQDEITHLQQVLAELNAQKQDRYNAMKLRIKYMYESGSTGTMALLLTSGSLSELFTRTEYIQQISMYDRRMLVELEDIFKQENENNKKLTSDLSQLDTLKEESEWQQQVLTNLIADKQSQISLSDELIAQTEDLAMQYETILNAQKEAEEAASAPSTPTSDSFIYDSSSSSEPTEGSTIDTSAVNGSELAMMAAIIECEAGNQSYEGLLAVGSVIMNRINSPIWPNSLTAVLYQSGQFTPVASGRFAIVLARGATARCTQAATEVLAGRITIPYTFFHTNRPSDANKNGMILGDHFFY